MPSLPMAGFRALLASLSIVMLADGAEIFDNSAKMALLAAHNRIRESVHPTAAGMPYMTWSPTLEETAQRQAYRCWEMNQLQSLGELRYFRSTAQQLPPAWQIVSSWYMQRRGYLGGDDRCIAAGVCDAYLQLMTDRVTEVGCAYHLCRREHHVRCVYSARLSRDSHPYAIGELCSACPADRSRCLNGLCIGERDLERVNELEPGTNLRWQQDVTVATEWAVCKPDSRNELQSSGCSCSCLNGGQPSKVDANAGNCRCDCPAAFFGRRCEVPKSTRDNSVVLQLSTKLVKPVSLSLFKAKVWPRLQALIADSLTTHCFGSQAMLESCCNGESNWHQAIGGKSAEASSYNLSRMVEHSHDLISTRADGVMTVFVHANVSRHEGARLCRHPEGRGGSTYLSSEVMRDAIWAQRDSINAGLKSCCEDVTLKSAELPGVQMSAAATLGVQIWLIATGIFCLCCLLVAY